MNIYTYTYHTPDGAVPLSGAQCLHVI